MSFGDNKAFILIKSFVYDATHRDSSIGAANRRNEPIGSNCADKTGYMATLNGVRRAKMEDYAAVLKIHDNVYEGFDYLPSMFYIFLQSHKHLVLVREIENGQLVSELAFLQSECVLTERCTFNFVVKTANK